MPTFAEYPDDLQLPNPRVVVEKLYSSTIQDAVTLDIERSRSPFSAKSILEVPELIKQVIQFAEEEEEIASDKRVNFTVEEPDIKMNLESIVFSIIRRQPGAVGSGAPFESTVKNYKPFLREEKDDSDNPGYRIAILGYWHDNLIELTCCARSSWAAERKALWLESVLRKYTWWLRLQGINRFFFWERNERDNIAIVIDNNKIYTKTLKYFVRTEELTKISSKKLEELTIKMQIQRV